MKLFLALLISFFHQINISYNWLGSQFDRDVVINEINIDDIGGAEFDEFIELKAVVPHGQPNPPLRQYMVITVF